MHRHPVFVVSHMQVPMARHTVPVGVGAVHSPLALEVQATVGEPQISPLAGRIQETATMSPTANRTNPIPKELR
jgi:hypothetical protein